MKSVDNNKDVFDYKHQPFVCMSHNIYFARLTINHVDRVRLRENCDSALKLLFHYIEYFSNVNTKPIVHYQTVFLD